MHFKDLYNQKNKDDLIKDLKNENFDRITISFYKYTTLKNLEELRDSLYLEWKKLQILGRIYIAPEGINAQISIPTYQLKLFKKNIAQYDCFKNLNFKEAIMDGTSFLKLVIKIL